MMTKKNDGCYNDTMFSHYPKKREPLPPEYQAIYKQHFAENRKGSTRTSSAASKMEAWMHRRIAEDVEKAVQSPRTLELGAGGLNHLCYEPDVKHYDVVEPYTDLIQESPYKDRVQHFYKDIFEVPQEPLYQRIISIAVLEHLEELPRIVAKSGLLMTEDGSFRAGIPNEGTILWKLGYRLTTGIEFRQRYKLDYEILMRHEHVNTADDIDAVLTYFFQKVRCRVFGLSKGFAFYRFYECHGPDKDKCREYLKEIESKNQ
ncbi:MAG: class I SAM-dependent methyltransferase [Candidatus Omnitrophica bacterium]|nr:class I SAM-dependent methyltransferase [Candidatus Omnitrophota bacterium]